MDEVSGRLTEGSARCWVSSADLGLWGRQVTYEMARIERRAALFRVVWLPDGMIYDYVSERSAT
jgi:hypothetical protein